MSAISILAIRQPAAKSRRTASLAIVTPAIGLFVCVAAMLLLTGKPWTTVVLAA